MKKSQIGLLLGAIAVAVGGAGVVLLHTPTGSVVKADATQLKAMSEIRANLYIDTTSGDLSYPWLGDYATGDLADKIGIKFSLFDAGTTQTTDAAPTFAESSIVATLNKNENGYVTNADLTAALKSASFTNGHYVGVAAQYVPLTGYESTYSASAYSVFNNSYLYHPFALKVMSSLGKTTAITTTTGQLDYPWLSDFTSANTGTAGNVEIEFDFFDVGTTQVTDVPTFTYGTTPVIATLLEANSEYVTNAMVTKALVAADVFTDDYIGVAARYVPISSVSGNPYTTPSDFTVFKGSYSYKTSTADIMAGRSVLASDETQGTASYAVDGVTTTEHYWGTVTNSTADQWLLIDLGSAFTVTKFSLSWEGARPTNYEIYFGFPSNVSTTSFTGKIDAQMWGDAAVTKTEAGQTTGTDDFTSLSVSGRYALVLCHNPSYSGAYGMKLFEISAYGSLMSTSANYNTMLNSLTNVTCAMMNASPSGILKTLTDQYNALTDTEKTLLTTTILDASSYKVRYDYLISYCTSKGGTYSSFAGAASSDKDYLMSGLLIGLSGLAIGAASFAMAKKKKSN